MAKRLSSQKGFSSVELVLVVVAIAIIAFIGWFVYHTKQNSDKVLDTATTTSNNAGPHFASSKSSPSSSSSTSKSALQSDLNSVNSSSSQSNQDLSGSNSSLGDQSTFTAVPQ